MHSFILTLLPGCPFVTSTKKQSRWYCQHQFTVFQTELLTTPGAIREIHSWTRGTAHTSEFDWQCCVSGRKYGWRSDQVRWAHRAVRRRPRSSASILAARRWLFLWYHQRWAMTSLLCTFLGVALLLNYLYGQVAKYLRNLIMTVKNRVILRQRQGVEMIS